MKIYGIIPARSGSKSILNKNIKSLSGYPLLAYSIAASKLCNGIDETIVTTDSVKYKKIAEKYNTSVIMRPEYLSNDTSEDYNYLLHAIFILNMNYEDLIVLLRPTTPLRSIDKIQYVIKQLDFKYSALRSMHKLSEAPAKAFKYADSEKILMCPYMNVTMEETSKPKQYFPDCYMPNGYIDIIKVKTAIETRTAFGDKIMGYDTGRVTDIDSLEDFKFLEYEMEKNKNCHEIYKYLRKNYECIEK